MAQELLSPVDAMELVHYTRDWTLNHPQMSPHAFVPELEALLLWLALLPSVFAARVVESNIAAVVQASVHPCAAVAQGAKVALSHLMAHPQTTSLLEDDVPRCAFCLRGKAMAELARIATEATAAMGPSVAPQQMAPELRRAHGSLL